MNKDPPKSLFVTNLPYSLDLENFKSYFTKFGPVERFDIPDHPNKPIAFVHFQNADDAARCLKENNGILYKGKILCIKFSSKAKPEHAPPLPSTVKTDAESNASSSNPDKPENENYSKHYDHDDIHSNMRRRRHEGMYNDYESRRRNPSPDYEYERRRDPYRDPYMDKPRERIPYRDRMPREPPGIRDRDPPYYRDRESDYYYDDYRRDYPSYHHHRSSNDHRDREPMHGYHERDLRDQRERDYYDYQYSTQPPLQSTHQIPQSQLPQTLPYNISQNSPIMSQTQSTSSQQSLPSPLNSIPAMPQQVTDAMQIDPRSQMMRSPQLPPPPPPLPPPPPPPPPPPSMQPSSRMLSTSSSIQQPQQQQYDYNDNRYYNTYQ